MIDEVADRMARSRGGTDVQWRAVVAAYVDEHEAAVVELTDADVEVALREWWHEDLVGGEASPLHGTGLSSHSGGAVRRAVLELCGDEWKLSRILAALVHAEVDRARGAR